MPILGAFVNSPNIPPFPIGLYIGNKDPENVDSYLQEFVPEVQDLLENGCEVTPQKISNPFKIRCYICDMVGRSYIKCAKGTSLVTVVINAIKDVVELMGRWYIQQYQEN